MNRNKVITLRLSEEEKKAFDKYCSKKGITTSEQLRELVNSLTGINPQYLTLEALEARIKALESKLTNQTHTPPKPLKSERSETIKEDLEGLELITIEQVASLTGYSLSTLGSKLSREGVKAKSRIDGNRGGLYSKEEVLSKIGKK